MRRPSLGLPASSTPFPCWGFPGLLGLYSLYLLHTGIAILMKPAPDKALYYTIAVVLCVIVIEVIVFFVNMRAIVGIL